ncbi:MAG: diguanylate cyclase [Gammaproteobacteria bacterium]|nr:diguanylate cyclase [Gammaproteobacteria bacterium]NNM19854.1 diguanylate cyclase [Gammaproteobacteria bacterium]
MSKSGEGRAAPTPFTPAGVSGVPRLLVVDDSPETRYIYRRLLQKADYTHAFEEADTVADALRRLRNEKFDCVLLDFCLPDGDGLDLLKALAPDTSVNTPVIMITGEGSEPVAVEAMKLGAKDYLVKDNITQDRLVGTLDYAMDQAQTERALLVYREELEQASVTDPLTGLHNRRYLSEHLQIELQRCARYGSPLSLLMIDLDHFKALNDRYGHVVGDKVLQEFAAMLRRVARNTDIVARYGGEEFCVVLTNTDFAGGAHLAERICEEARAMRHDDGAGGQLTVTCSTGMATASDEGEPQVLIERADKALYRAKRLGRDQACLAEVPVTASA